MINRNYIYRKERKMVSFSFIFIIVLATLIAVGGIIGGVSLYTHTSEYTITITNKERVYQSEDSKYLVFGEDVNGSSLVFENTDSLFYGKWNSSNIQGQFKEGNTYTIKVYGYRIPFLSMYENIIEITE